jgi:hypothetical protein
MEAKAHDYTGDEDCNKNIQACEKLGICKAETGILIRVLDKLQRLDTLSKAEAMVKDESIYDTLHDIRNYCAIYFHIKQEEDARRAAKG